MTNLYFDLDSIPGQDDVGQQKWKLFLSPAADEYQLPVIQI